MKKSFANFTKQNNDHLASDSDAHEQDRSTVKIVQCPACQTTFAVQKAALEAVSIPRFHCSRCDNVFTCEYEEATSQYQTNESQSNSNSSYTTKTGNNDNDFSPLEYQSMESEPSTQKSDFATVFDYEINSPLGDETQSHGWTIGDTLNKSANLLAGQMQNLKSLQNSSDSKKNISLDSVQSISNSWTDGLFSGMPTKTASTDQQTQMELLLNPGFRRKKYFNYDDPDFKMDDSSALDPIPSSAIAAITNNGTPQLPGALSEKNKEITKTKAVKNKIKLPNINFQQLKLWDNSGKSLINSNTKKQKNISNWKSLGLVSSPLIICTVLLTFAGYILTQNPKEAWGLGASLSSSLPEIPPTTLQLNKTTHKIIELESGERLHLLTGEIKNNGNREFREVTIQGLLFDKNGSLSTSQNVLAANSLTRARVPSLSWEMIEKLQQTPQSRRFTLEPGQSAGFALAINSAFAPKASYLSARIYSVRR